MKLSLYNIETEYLKLTEALIENGGELTPELEEALQLNKENLSNKATNYGFVIKQIEHECDIIDLEIERLSKIKKSRENSVKRLKNTISSAMQIYDVEEIKTPILTINFRKSQSVEVIDLKLLDRKFIKVSTPVESADKAAIKEAMASGETVIGATLVDNKNLQIK